jgi:hypothetical protein
MRKFLTPDATLRRVFRTAKGGGRGVEKGRATCECARCSCLASGAGVQYLAAEAATTLSRRAHMEDEMDWDFEIDGGTRAQHKRLFGSGRSKARLTLPRQSLPGIRLRHFRRNGKAF